MMNMVNLLHSLPIASRVLVMCILVSLINSQMCMALAPRADKFSKTLARIQKAQENKDPSLSTSFLGYVSPGDMNRFAAILQQEINHENYLVIVETLRRYFSSKRHLLTNGMRKLFDDNISPEIMVGVIGEILNQFGLGFFLRSTEGLKAPFHMMLPILNSTKARETGSTREYTILPIVIDEQLENPNTLQRSLDQVFEDLRGNYDFSRLNSTITEIYGLGLAPFLFGAALGILYLYASKAPQPNVVVNCLCMKHSINYRFLKSVNLIEEEIPTGTTIAINRELPLNLLSPENEEFWFSGDEPIITGQDEEYLVCLIDTHKGGMIRLKKDTFPGVTSDEEIDLLQFAVIESEKINTQYISAYVDGHGRLVKGEVLREMLEVANKESGFQGYNFNAIGIAKVPKNIAPMMENVGNGYEGFIQYISKNNKPHIRIKGRVDLVNISVTLKSNGNMHTKDYIHQFFSQILYLLAEKNPQAFENMLGLLSMISTAGIHADPKVISDHNRFGELLKQYVGISPDERTHDTMEELFDTVSKDTEISNPSVIRQFDKILSMLFSRIEKDGITLRYLRPSDPDFVMLAEQIYELTKMEWNWDVPIPDKPVFLDSDTLPDGYGGLSDVLIVNQNEWDQLIFNGYTLRDENQKVIRNPLREFVMEQLNNPNSSYTILIGTPIDEGKPRVIAAIDEHFFYGWDDDQRTGFVDILSKTLGKETRQKVFDDLALRRKVMQSRDYQSLSSERAGYG